MADNLQRKSDFEQEHYFETQTEPKFIEYQGQQNLNQMRLQELIFFASIASFCVATAILSLLFLTLNLSAFVSFTLAMLISLVIGVVSRFTYTFIKQKNS